MKTLLNTLMQQNIDPVLKGHIPLNFKDAKRIIVKLKAGDHDQWIRIYKYINPNDRPLLITHYIEKLQKVLAKEYSVRTIDTFKSVWQYYKPLEDLTIQQKLIEIIESGSSSGYCDKLHQHLNSLLQGEILPSRYARDIIISMIKTYLQAATSCTFPSQAEQYMSISIDEWNTMEIYIDTNDRDDTMHMSRLLERTIPTFELLMRNMNKQDREFTQLLVAYILEPDVINTSIHLSKYVPVISLWSAQISIQELVTILHSITSETPTDDPDVKLPELLSDSYI